MGMSMIMREQTSVFKKHLGAVDLRHIILKKKTSPKMLELL